VILLSNPLAEGQVGQRARWTNAARREDRPGRWLDKPGKDSLASDGSAEHLPNRIQLRSSPTSVPLVLRDDCEMN
jgi:hypothetical protein